MDIHSFVIGQKAYYVKKISEDDVIGFGNITDDYNYIHFNEEKATHTIFKGRIVHGMLTAGLISKVIGTQLPGEGSIYLEQHIKFLKPVRIGDTIKAEVEIEIIDYEKNNIFLRTICCNNDTSEIVIDGQAKVKYLEKQYY